MPQHDAPGDARRAPAPRPLTLKPGRAEREAAAAELRRAFCVQLQTSRERRGLSFSSLASATKVSESLFVELEQGDLSHWPLGIYRRSFFREYCRLVGLPVESTTSEFVRLFPEEPGGATRSSLAPGPLRLTLARSALLRMPGVKVRAALLDASAVIVVAAALAFVSGLNIWMVLGVVTLGYHLISTAILGSSLATWWLTQRGGRPQGSKLLGFLLVLFVCAVPALAQDTDFQPEIGQPGKDVVWVPSPTETVEAMLDLAQVTPRDFVMDLGSGDGRNVIAAATRGARALGVEYNPDMVALSRRAAAAAGVSDRAQFVEGDMFAADISEADVLALFLLPSNLLRLRAKFLDLHPGARIVSNTFSIQDWAADETVELSGDCNEWCSAHLYIVPAKVAGTWHIGTDTLRLEQAFQMVTGTLASEGISTPVQGKLRGAELSLTAGDRTFTGLVREGQIEGTVRYGDNETPWVATR